MAQTLLSVLLRSRDPGRLTGFSRKTQRPWCPTAPSMVQNAWPNRSTLRSFLPKSCGFTKRFGGGTKSFGDRTKRFDGTTKSFGGRTKYFDGGIKRFDGITKSPGGGIKRFG